MLTQFIEIEKLKNNGSLIEKSATKLAKSLNDLGTSKRSHKIIGLLDKIGRKSIPTTKKQRVLISWILPIQDGSSIIRKEVCDGKIIHSKRLEKDKR